MLRKTYFMLLWSACACSKKDYTDGQFLHITDMHLDPHYSVGSPNKCTLGSTGLGCCRAYNVAIPGSHPAGKWGDKGCDLPFSLFNATLAWISDRYPALNFVLYGGDTVDHHDVTQTQHQNVNTMNTAANLFYTHFKGTSFIPNQGNHDTYPIDQTVPYIEKSIRRSMAKGWEPLIGEENANMFTNNGFFKTEVSDSLTVVSINSIDYDGRNTFRRKTVQGDTQDKWLNDTLATIRSRGEHAFILGHIFPTAGESTDVYNAWLLGYLQRYSDIIRGTFFGHSHKDEFKVRYSNNTMHIPPVLVGPSLMADQRDPCFRIYNYSQSANELVDYRQYCVDLDATNKADKLEVYLDYAFRDEYGLPDATSSSYGTLVSEMNSDDDVAMKYCVHYIGEHPVGKVCDLELAKQLVADVNLEKDSS